MAEQFLTLMADLDDASQAIMGQWYDELKQAGFTGVQTPELLQLRQSLKTKTDEKFPWTPHATILIDEAEIIQKALPIFVKSFHPFFGKITRLHLCAFWPTREVLIVELKGKN